MSEPQQNEDARQRLSRHFLGRVTARPTQTLTDIVDEIIDEESLACDCESAEDLEELRSGIEDLISDLKGLL